MVSFRTITNMAITFPNIETIDGSRMIVAFPADQNGNRIKCAISTEALEDNFNGNNVPSLDCFRANRSRIESKTASLIERGRFEMDGSILVRSGDGT